MYIGVAFSQDWHSCFLDIIQADFIQCSQVKVSFVFFFLTRVQITASRSLISHPSNLNNLHNQHKHTQSQCLPSHLYLALRALLSSDEADTTLLKTLLHNHNQRNSDEGDTTVDQTMMRRKMEGVDTTESTIYHFIHIPHTILIADVTTSFSRRTSPTAQRSHHKLSNFPFSDPAFSSERASGNSGVLRGMEHIIGAFQHLKQSGIKGAGIVSYSCGVYGQYRIPQRPRNLAALGRSFLHLWSFAASSGVKKRLCLAWLEQAVL